MMHFYEAEAGQCEMCDCWRVVVALMSSDAELLPSSAQAIEDVLWGSSDGD